MIQPYLGRSAPRIPFVLLLLAAAACGSGSGDDPCLSCPEPVTDGALRMTIQFDEDARSLEPAGFRTSDLSTIEIEVTGGPAGVQRLSLSPSTTGAFMTLDPGTYQVSAKALGAQSLLLFSDAAQVMITVGDTVDLTLAMAPELGPVTLTVDGKTSGTIEAVAGEDVPFSVVVKNSENRPVPDVAVDLRTAVAGYGQVAFDSRTSTDAAGTVTGVIRAPFSGTLDLTLEVDGRPVPSPGPTRIEFATGVSAAHSEITFIEVTERPFPSHPLANGFDTYTFTVEVRDHMGQPLAGIPVAAVSNRNTGADPTVDIIEPRVDYQSRTTDAFGRYIFSVRSTTSSFLTLDPQGRLTSDGGNGTFFPLGIEIFADGVSIDQRSTLIFNSVVDPNGIEFSPNKQFVAANGQDFAVVEVESSALSMFGGGAASNVLVEIVDANGHPIDSGLTVVPAPGYTFRTNASGIWRGRLSRTTPGAVFFFVKVDGRTVNPWQPRSLIFQ